MREGQGLVLVNRVMFRQRFCHINPDELLVEMVAVDPLFSRPFSLSHTRARAHTYCG